MNPNHRRTERIYRMILSMYEKEDEEASVKDILADTMHFCPEYGIDFERCLDTAREHYEAETEGYTVTNTYGIAGESRHRTPWGALRAADKREGTGWIVRDDDGNRWDWGGRDGDTPVRAD